MDVAVVIVAAVVAAGAVVGLNGAVFVVAFLYLVC